MIDNTELKKCRQDITEALEYLRTNPEPSDELTGQLLELAERMQKVTQDIRTQLGIGDI